MHNVLHIVWELQPIRFHRVYQSEYGKNRAVLAFVKLPRNLSWSRLGLRKQFLYYLQVDIMGLGHGYGNYDPNNADDNSAGETSLSAIAEQSIVNTIMEGGAGPEEMSDGGLRFIRYLLSISRAARFGFLPNFRDLNAVREIAKQFIRYCGSSAVALYTMNQVLEGDAFSR